MGEKSYGGSNGLSKGKMVVGKSNSELLVNKEVKKLDKKETKLDNQDKYEKAGKIAQEVRNFAKSIIKKGELLLEIAEKIESKIIELGGKPAFPCNLSINDVAAHYTPSYNDETKASGLLKIDFGVHVKGCIADTAFSIDLENSEASETLPVSDGAQKSDSKKISDINKKLIQASEEALKAAIETAKQRKSISEIGKSIHDEITKHKFSPIRNLSGHSLAEYHIHAGVTIPNYDNGNNKILEQGAYAIEPFATTGQGLVYDGKPSGIYRVEKIANVRDSLAREILGYVAEEFQTLPFCSRWIVKKFGTRSLISLKLMEQAQVLFQYNQLIEQSHKPVSQAEHTILVSDKIEQIS